MGLQMKSFLINNIMVISDVPHTYLRSKFVKWLYEDMYFIN